MDRITLPSESMKVDVVESNVAKFIARGVIGITVGDVVEVAIYISMDKVARRAVSLVNGEESEFDLDLMDAQRLMTEVPELQNYATRMVRFDEGEGATEPGEASSGPAMPADVVPDSPVAVDAPTPAPPGPPPTPGRLRAKLAAIRKSPAFAEAAVEEDESSAVKEYLAAAGLTGYASSLTKAMITNMHELRGHTVLELEASLRRPHVIKAKDFKFSDKEKRGWVWLGLRDDSEPKPEPPKPAAPLRPPPPPPRPTRSLPTTAATLEEAFGGALEEADLDRMGDLFRSSEMEGEKGRPKEPGDLLHDLLQDTPAAAVLLGRCQVDELTMDALKSILQATLGAMTKEMQDIDVESIEKMAISTESNN
jgi:hypothetical protein